METSEHEDDEGVFKEGFISEEGGKGNVLKTNVQKVLTSVCWEEASGLLRVEG